MHQMDKMVSQTQASYTVMILAQARLIWNHFFRAGIKVEIDRDSVNATAQYRS